MQPHRQHDKANVRRGNAHGQAAELCNAGLWRSCPVDQQQRLRQLGQGPFLHGAARCQQPLARPGLRLEAMHALAACSQRGKGAACPGACLSADKQPSQAQS